MTIEEAKQKLIAWLNAQVGTREGANNWNKYAEDPRLTQLYGWNVQNQPWCDIFTDAAFVACFGLETGAAMTYQPIGQGSAACSVSAQYFKNNGAWFSTPQVGDVVFFYLSGGINHQGIVTAVGMGAITTVEGNSSDMVARRTYSLGSAQIAGYGRPNWALAARDDAGAAVNTSSAPDGAPSPEGEGMGNAVILDRPEGAVSAANINQDHAIYFVLDNNDTATELGEPGVFNLNTSLVPLPTLREGDRSPAVLNLQRLLIPRGYYCGGKIRGGREIPDGEFGPATLSSVKRFQTSVGLTVDGVIGPMTWAALLGV